MSGSDPAPPHFSIVIPAYNRAGELERALESCLHQRYGGFEVIVVDDASSDGTHRLQQVFADPRIRWVRHDRNRGVCAARNTGVDRARGEWIVFLDSDDELLPEALEIMHARETEAGDAIERMGFMYRAGDGRLLPYPAPRGQVLDYEGYIRWADRVVYSDFNNCIRRRTFEQVRLPETRAYEGIYHLDFARKFRTRLFADVVAVVHTEAGNRTTNLSWGPLIRKMLAEAADGAAGLEELVRSHGSALERHAPAMYRKLCRKRIEMHLLAGQTRQGLSCLTRYWRAYPLSLDGWLIAMLGLAGPQPLAWARAFRLRWAR